MSTNDPNELARETIEEMIAQRLIEEALNGTPASVEERFRNLDVQLAASAPSPDPDDLWTAEPNEPLNALSGVGGFWCIFPPKNDPNINHPRAPYIFQHHSDGRRVIYIGPIPKSDNTIQNILNEGNKGR